MANDDETPAELPPTALAALVAKAKEKVVQEPDRFGPAAMKAMAAIVRDLKGMPELSVTRESGMRLRLARKGKVGFVVIDYDAAVHVIEVSSGGFHEPVEPGTPKAHRYTLQDGEWHRMDGGGELFAEIQRHLTKIYPELAAD